MKKRIASALLALLAILGVFEGFLAVRAGIRDNDGDIGRQWTTLQYVMRGLNPYPVALAALRTTYGDLASKAGAILLLEFGLSPLVRNIHRSEKRTTRDADERRGIDHCFGAEGIPAESKA